TSMAIGRWLADRGDGIGIVEGHCWSAANDIFLCCARRIARPGARFIVHEAQSYVMGGAQAFRRAASELDKLMTPHVDFFCERLPHLQRGEIEKWVAPDVNTEFSADQALAAGLVQAIEPEPVNQSIVNGDTVLVPAVATTQTYYDKLATQLAIALRGLQ